MKSTPETVLKPALNRSRFSLSPIQEKISFKREISAFTLGRNPKKIEEKKLLTAEKYEKD